MSTAPGKAPSELRESLADLIVVGTGVAGLRAAIEAAAAGLRVQLLAKGAASESNTDKAQGGIAVALSDEDRVGLHLSDTVAAGVGLCDEEAVRILVEQGPPLITELIGWGAAFDREGSRLAFTREGAHSASRVLHAGGDSTGQEILRALIGRARREEGLTFTPGLFTLELLVERGRCAGLTCLDASGHLSIFRGRVLLATGGCGRVFRETTNPPQATGDGIAMAWRAGAWLRDMEFVQFHPTALALPGAPRFLLSEALRGEGGILRDGRGERFMTSVDPGRAELAPRDVVSRAIAMRMLETGSTNVWLDMTGRDEEFLRRRFPAISATCLSYGVDIAAAPIPVSPSAHYMMGGVATDLHGRTSLPGLYAAGEVACTGVHGANRLASNSLLEGLVYGARAGRAVIEDAASGVDVAMGAGRLGEAFDPGLEIPSGWPPAGPAAEHAETVAARVREIAWERAGLLREAAGLREAVGELLALGVGRASPAGAIVERAAIEAGNLMLVAALIARAAFARRESRGAHFRTDHPSTDDARLRLSVLSSREGGCRGLRISSGRRSPLEC
jgi:L-aspartate oxidase